MIHIGSQKRIRRFVQFLIVFYCCLTPVLARAADDAALKAALIYKLSQFVTWPQQSVQSFAICSDADKAVITALKKLEQRTISGLPIRVEPLKSKGGISLKECQIIYLTKSDPDNVSSVLMQVSHNAVLTISDIKNFSKFGGMIEISSKQQRLHFLINLKAAREASLKIASPLLEISTIVSK